MRLLFFLLLLFSITNDLSAQDLAPSIYGVVSHATTGQPLEGATIFLNAENEQATITNEKGQYSFKNLAAGRYSIQVDFLGFQSQRQVEILLEAGRNQEINIPLVPTALELPTAVVRAGVADATSQLLPGVQILTIEETRRLPATFNDPARQLLSYPGVANANDQANNISVRGNSPAALSWRIEGAEIVNPNHLSNAGTRSDAISTSGGGVNMLSTQMLNTSTFYAGGAPARYGNMQGGLLDMQLRAGNRDQWESTLQLGLLGLDVSFEGPFTMQKKSSYLFNYRYSTLGLLDALGVQISEEAIKFQDAALHLNFPTEKMGHFALFGINGSSSNIFTAERDTSVWTIQKDRTDVDYNSYMRLAGMTHQISLGKRGSWNTTAVYSTSSNIRTAKLIQKDFFEITISDQQALETKMSLVSAINVQWNPRIRMQGGLEYLHANYDLFNFPKGSIFDGFTNDVDFNTWRPFIDFNFQLSAKFSIDAGLNTVWRFMDNINEFDFVPRLNTRYNLSNNQQLILSYNKFNRQQPSFFYLTPKFDGLNDDLSSINGHNFSFSHKINIRKSSTIKTEIYYQRLSNAITLSSPRNLYSSLNIEELVFPPFGPLTNDGKGRNYGIELLWQKYITEDFYYIVNGTVFNSEYKNHDQEWRATRYNAKYISNATVGKEFRWQKKRKDQTLTKDKTLGINIRMTYLGNLRYTPIDLEASQDSNREILDLDNVYGQQLTPYFKGDLRIYLRTDKQKYSNSLSLDIQNFLNRKNQGFFFYDPDTETIQEKNQLGLIPILSWRLSF